MALEFEEFAVSIVSIVLALEAVLHMLVCVAFLCD